MALLKICFSYAFYQISKYKAMLSFSFKGIQHFNENLFMFRHRGFSRPPDVKTKPNQNKTLDLTERNRTLSPFSPCLHTHFAKCCCEGLLPLQLFYPSLVTPSYSIKFSHTSHLILGTHLLMMYQINPYDCLP